MFGQLTLSTRIISTALGFRLAHMGPNLLSYCGHSFRLVLVDRTFSLPQCQLGPYTTSRLIPAASPSMLDSMPHALKYQCLGLFPLDLRAEHLPTYPGSNTTLVLPVPRMAPGVPRPRLSPYIPSCSPGTKSPDSRILSTDTRSRVILVDPDSSPIPK